MASLTPLAFLLLSIFHILCPQTLAATPSAPAPSPSGPANVTGILDKAGQYTTLIRLLTSTQVGTQIENQLNTSTQGLTILAPTDNAFNNLKAGTLNSLTTQQQVDLILYHVIPMYYSLDQFSTVSNPVRTQASFSDGSSGLNFTAQSASQVNVTSGLVTTQINNALVQTFPLAMYQVDKVLLPEALFGVKSPSTTAPSSPAKTPSSPQSGSSTANETSTTKDNSGSSGGRSTVGLGLVVALVGFVMCMGSLSI